MRTCEVCGIDISDKKETAKTCSPKCRKLAFQKRSVGTEEHQNGTPIMLVKEQQPELYLSFYTLAKANGLGREKDEKSIIRKALYWYDVPLAAIPIVEEGWPEVPEFMNGRHYFLWMKNEFKVSKDGTPIILNPYPKYEKLEYFMGGEGSRRWGA